MSTTTGRTLRGAGTIKNIALGLVNLTLALLLYSVRGAHHIMLPFFSPPLLSIIETVLKTCDDCSIDDIR